MSFNAFIMPAAPPPHGSGVESGSGAKTAAFKHEGSADAVGQYKGFLSTLKRASQSQTSDTPTSRSAASDTESARPLNEHRNTDQQTVEGSETESEETPVAQESRTACKRPILSYLQGLLHEMSISEGGAQMPDGETKPDTAEKKALLNSLMGHILSEGQNLPSGKVGIGPFEQLQTGISPDDVNLSFLKQLLNQADVPLNAVDTSGPQGLNSFSGFWPSMATTGSADNQPTVQAGHLAARVDELIHFLLQRTGGTSLTEGLQGANIGAGGQKAALHRNALTIAESMVSGKMSGDTQMEVAEKGVLPTGNHSTSANVNMLMQTHFRKGGEDSQPANSGSGSKGPEAAVNANMLMQTRFGKGGEDFQQANSGSGSKGPEAAVNANMLMLTHFSKGGEDSQPANSGSGSKGPEAVINPNPAGEFILAKTAEQGIQFKTTGVQSGILPTDPAGSKVVQIDGEGKDSGFLASQESLPEHLSRLEQAGRSSEGAQRNLASQTLNQIVQKAVLLNNNGQSTVQIDLKPDFLGHIRMQIVTESQQVVVRIVAEFPFVKDMLDSNLNQLRTELQAQGLDVDELEVSVADDSQANEDLYQKTAEARRAQAAKNNQLAADAAAEDQSYLPAARSSGMADSVIDFFV